MYPSRVPLSVPYWNGATYREIFRSLLSRSVIHGKDLKKLVSVVLREIGVEEAILCGSGSFALEIVLRACGVRPSDEVVIPTFCCTAVVPPILAVGAIPVMADVGEDLNLTPENVDAVLSDRTRAIIVPHLFGNPADIHGIIDLASGRDIRVIDDAAQALGATIDGRPAGSFGDAGILSFGWEKICSGLGGGMAVSRHQGLLGREIELFTPRLSPILGDLLSTLVWRRWRRWTFPAEALLHRVTTGPEAPPAPYRRETMANLNAAAALSLIETLGENIAARRRRVRAYRELLRKDERLALVSHGPGSACLAQVVQILPGRRGTDLASRLIDVLRNAGYEIQGSYVPIHLLPQYEPWVRRPLPRAETVWGHLVELPCEPEVSLDHVERMAAIVKLVLNS